jgi:hypothetical protein
MTAHRGRRGSNPGEDCGVDGSKEGGATVRVDLFVESGVHVVMADIALAG